MNIIYVCVCVEGEKSKRGGEREKGMEGEREGGEGRMSSPSLSSVSTPGIHLHLSMSARLLGGPTRNVFLLETGASPEGGKTTHPKVKGSKSNKL